MYGGIKYTVECPDMYHVTLWPHGYRFFFSNWLGLLFSKRKTIAYFFAYINLIALSDLQCAKIHSEIISASGMLLAYS